MSDLFANLALGLSVAAQPQNLLWCFCGCLLGTLIGVLPGIGPVATIAMLLPITYYPKEFPRLCRGGSRSLTFKGVHRRSFRIVSRQAHEGEVHRWTNLRA